MPRIKRTSHGSALPIPSVEYAPTVSTNSTVVGLDFGRADASVVAHVALPDLGRLNLADFSQLEAHIHSELVRRMHDAMREDMEELGQQMMYGTSIIVDSLRQVVTLDLESRVHDSFVFSAHRATTPLSVEEMEKFVLASARPTHPRRKQGKSHNYYTERREYGGPQPFATDLLLRLLHRGM